MSGHKLTKDQRSRDNQPYMGETAMANSVFFQGGLATGVLSAAQPTKIACESNNTPLTSVLIALSV